MLSKLKRIITSRLFMWALVTLTVLFQFLLQTSVSVMVPFLRHDFNTDVLGVSLISASFFYTYIFLQMPAGMLFDRFSARRILTIGIGGTGLACLLFATAHSVTVSIISRLIMGAFCSVAFPGALYVAATLFPPRRFAFLVGITEMLGMTGAAIGEQVLAFSVDRYGWRESTFVCAGVAFLFAILIYFTVKLPKVAPVSAEQSTRYTKRSMFLAVLKIPQAWLCGLYSGLMFAIISAFASLWCIPYIEKLYQISLSQAATAAAMVFFGAALGNPLFGWVSDKLGRRKPLILMSAMLTSLLIIIIFNVTNVSLPVMIGLLFCLGFVCCGYALPFAVVRESSPAYCRGTALGFVNMMSIIIGAPILQPLIGWLLSEHLSPVGEKSITSAVGLAAYQHVLGGSLLACSILAILVGLLIKETYCREIEV